MPDPSVTLTAIQSHASVLGGAVVRRVKNAAHCKVWSGAMVLGMMFLSSGRVQMAALPWAAGVVVLMAVAEAGQLAMARVFTDAYNRFMAKLPLNGGNAMKAEEWLVLPSPTLNMRQAGQVFAALGSFSVWPFYGALLALLVGFHVQSLQAEKSSARLLPSAATNLAKPASGNVKASALMNVGPSASSRPASGPFGSQSIPATNGKPPTVLNPNQPRQSPPGSQPFPPSAASPQQPPVRYPIAPPTRLPQNRAPQNGVPAPNGSPPQNVSPPQNGAVQPPDAGGTPSRRGAPLTPGADGNRE